MVTTLQSEPCESVTARDPREVPARPARAAGDGAALRRPASWVATPTGPSRRTFATSLAIHVVVFAALLAVPAGVMRQPKRPDPVDVVFYRPRVEIPPPVVPPVARQEPPAPRPQKAVEPPPAPVPVARTEPPRPRARVEARPESVPVAPKPAPAPARPKVRTDVLRDPTPAPVAAPAPARKTRTGTFGAAEVVAAQPSTVRTSAQVGSFEVPTAAAPAAVEPTRDRRPTTAGFGDVVAATETPDTDTRERAVRSATGFGSAAPAASGPPTSGKTGSVKAGQFGDGLVVAEAPRSRERTVAKPDTPVEILSKPRPSYTDEARRLRVEGEVVLEVTFVASGQLQVLGVVQSLGHGLDEAAMEAARSIEFKPARRNGLPVDHTARLHIVFQLA